MAEIKTIYKGESISLLFTFPAAYNMARLTSQKIFVGETEFAGVKDGQTVKLQLKSSDTDRMIGNHKIVLWMDDTTLGLRKPYCGDLVVAKTQAAGSTVSVSDISDIIIPIAVSETVVTVGDILYNYMKGDSAYQVWLDAGNTGTVEDYLAYLQQPATDAAGSIALLEGEIEGEEALRVTAETTRVQNEQARITAEGAREQNETAREDAEDDRVESEALRLSAETTRGQNEQARETAEGLRVTAEQLRQTNTATAITNANNAANNANTKAGLADTAANNANAKATLANDAATLANTKAGLADTAATNANNAASAISPAVVNNEEVQAEVYNLLNARIAALEAIIAAGVYNYIQADTLIGVQSLKYKGAEMILTGTAAPAIAPDFVGQTFVNTTGGVTYTAKGIASAADWKQTSN